MTSIQFRERYSYIAEKIARLSGLDEKEFKPLSYLSYGATPARLKSRIADILKHTAERGLACVHPFNAFPYEFYEGGILGREKTLDACRKLIDICGEFALYGISEGTLHELKYVIESNGFRRFPKPVRVFVTEFDPEWETYYKQYYDKYASALDSLNLKPDHAQSA